MSKRKLPSAALALAAGLAAATSGPAAAALFAARPIASSAAPGDLLLLADARSYHHCHNMPRRTRCHSRQRLPVNWPPNSNTPGNSSLSERHADQGATCSGDRRGWPCRR